MEEYFLHVDIIIKADKESEAEFEHLMGKFLGAGGLSPFTYKLRLALKGAHAFEYTGYATNVSSKGTEVKDKRGGNACRYVHLWSVPDLHDLDLAAAMTRSGDDTLYNEIHGMALSEAQNLVVRVASTTDRFEALAGYENFVRATRHFSPINLGRYVQGLNVLAPILAAQAKAPPHLRARMPHNWHSIGNLQNVTGELNSVVEFWQTDAGDPKARTFDAALEALGDQLQGSLAEPYRACDREVREYFQLAPYFS